jgi:hypothetical protein
MDNFRDIDGFPGYSITNSGIVKGPRAILKPATDKGYLKVSLWKDGKGHSKWVHRLVALAWVINPNPIEFICVNHKDTNKLNNSASNLEWCTHDFNMKHAWALGLPKAMHGSDHGMSKLSAEDISAIRSEYAAGISYRTIMAKYGIGVSHFYRIKNNQTWQHLSKLP